MRKWFSCQRPSFQPYNIQQAECCRSDGAGGCKGDKCGWSMIRRDKIFIVALVHFQQSAGGGKVSEWQSVVDKISSSSFLPARPQIFLRNCILSYVQHLNRVHGVLGRALAKSILLEGLELLRDVMEADERSYRPHLGFLIASSPSAISFMDGVEQEVTKQLRSVFYYFLGGMLRPLIL